MIYLAKNSGDNNSEYLETEVSLLDDLRQKISSGKSVETFWEKIDLCRKLFLVSSRTLVVLDFSC
ncbi:MAG: hypothetical protein F6K40_07840 [Okeania sp. SIO3I5]|uniref:hypothetical protein n=1 Tax=Okeania sp. SIO3I5 TaxID=2607805 RepID=UPI0013BDA69D|nr:hypothetical protein [Okeania sp. SIO3I5]NEQ36202.1 hypothetical protein [Okeania sp. SIO3I5]